MRFDDGLQTVLAADATNPAGVQATWRQLVDLIGRRRGAGGDDGDEAGAIARLTALQTQVPTAVRAATARGLERADPPAALVALFARDELAVAGPVVRSARLSANEWIALLPDMQPATRGILRHRRDLDDRVTAALTGFGPHDLTLAGDAIEAPAPSAVIASPPVATPPVPTPDQSKSADKAPPQPVFIAADPSPFVAVADIARELPVVAEALRRESVAAASANDDDYAVAELVARIEAHQRTAEPRPVAAEQTHATPTGFAFQTDPAGTIIWCDTVARGPLVGRSLTQDGGVADAAVAGALARRTGFADARLLVPGTSDAAGSWRISGQPMFDRATGRFTGYRGTARRPRADEEPRTAGAAGAGAGAGAAAGADTLRQLVHELRTPANAISGFAEMIERQMLGPVAADYRAQAATIRTQTAGLLDAIDDIDTAARLDGGRLDLRPVAVALAPLIARTLGDLAPLAELRGVSTEASLGDAAVLADPLAAERLVSRLLAALVAGAGRGERLTIAAQRVGASVQLRFDRPATWADATIDPFGADAEIEAQTDGALLLGTGFAFRLARKLATGMGGGLVVTADALTLRLPAAVDRAVEQATV